jgi:hypothetical protein
MARFCALSNLIPHNLVLYLFSVSDKISNTESRLRYKPLLRWTIGDVMPDGYECLVESIYSFLRLYEGEPVVCYNCPRPKIAEIESQLSPFVRFIDQNYYLDSCPVPPMGVAWKLYPPRLDKTRHELVIDNDIVLNKPVKEIDNFFTGHGTLLLGGTGRTYGRFERHVPPSRCINSGLYGMPPGFDMQKNCFFLRWKWLAGECFCRTPPK